MNEDFYIELIYKRLSEEITPPEAKQLESWRTASEPNQKTYDAVKQAWEASDLLGANVEVDINAEFETLEILMEEQSERVSSTSEAAVKTLQSKPQRKWLRIAASLLFFVVTAALLYQNFSGQNTVPSQMATISTENETKTIMLSDGSKVFLNKNSELIYPEQFNRDKRNVKLKGEAFFEVKHNTEQPFSINTEKETVTVLGTSFNIKNQADFITTVYVSTGKVQLEQTESGNKIILTQGEKGISNTQDKSLVEQKSTENEIAWHSRKLKFLDTPITEVEQLLEDFYNVELVFENSNLESCIFTSSFEQEPIEKVLEVLSTVLDLDIDKKSDNEYFIKGGNCN